MFQLQSYQERQKQEHLASKAIPLCITNTPIKSEILINRSPHQIVKETKSDYLSQYKLPKQSSKLPEWIDVKNDKA